MITMSEKTTVKLDEDRVDEVLETLEDGQQHAKRTASHDKVRPSAMLMGKKIKEAYRELVEAHPNYDYVENVGDDD